MAQIVPLSSSPNQTATVQLTVDGNPLTLNLTVGFSEMAGYWQMSVSDINNNLLIASVPLITGWYPAANLLAQYGYLQIGSAYILNTGNATTDYPAANNLNQFSLLWDDTAL
jgi:hypothetical protein